MVKAYWIVGLLILLFSNSFGQQTTDRNNQHIEVYPNHLLLSPYVETKSHLIQLDFTSAPANKKLNYLSNFILTSGIRFRYKWMNFQVGARLPLHRFNNQLGNTQNFAIGLSVVKRKFTLQTKYETFNGFYLQNTNEWIPGYRQGNERFYIRPDLKAQSLFTVYNYILNSRKFSNPAAVFQFERQKRAAFGIALGLSHLFNKMESDSSLVPANAQWHSDIGSSTYLVSNMLGLQIGFMATLPLFFKKRCFISTSLIPGYSIQTGSVTRGFINLLPSNFYKGLTNEFRFGFGYNAPKWFASVQMSSIGNLVQVRDSETYLVQNAYFRISTGYRFGK